MALLFNTAWQEGSHGVVCSVLVTTLSTLPRSSLRWANLIIASPNVWQ